MRVYILKRQEQDYNTTVVVAANTMDEAVDVLRNEDVVFLYFCCCDEHLNVIEDRKKWRFDSEEWEIYECLTLTANVDKPQIIDEIR